MADYLLIRGQSREEALDVLAVAAELEEIYGDDVQIDVATPAELAEVARLGGGIRRVVGISLPDVGELKNVNFGGMAEMKKDGLKKGLFSAVKKLSTQAAQGVKQYREVFQELRIANYDAVFDFDCTAFSMAVTKMAKAEKTITFAEGRAAEPMSGKALLYHENIYIDPRGVSASMRMRRLVARYLDYTPGALRDWRLRPPAEVACALPSSFLLLGGRIPPPFMDTLRARDLTLIGGDGGAYPSELADPPTLDELMFLIGRADAVIGNGMTAALATAIGVTPWYIGGEDRQPEGARLITTPTALAEALDSLTPSLASPPPEPPEPSPPEPTATPDESNKGIALKLKK